MGQPDMADAKETGAKKDKSLGDRHTMALLGMIHGYWNSQVCAPPPTCGLPITSPPARDGAGRGRPRVQRSARDLPLCAPARGSACSRMRVTGVSL